MVKQNRGNREYQKQRTDRDAQIEMELSTPMINWPRASLRLIHFR